MRNRVFSYITCNSQLLVLDHVAQPELTMQVPGGTVELGESPEYAAIREGTEETGIVELEVRKFLGDFEINLTPIGRNETIHAWFFHLEAIGSYPRRWRHLELDPHDNNDPIEFELYWIDLVPKPAFGGIDGARYEQLIKSALCNVS